ncbi:tyrosine-type recombinase/integrase [Colwellia sp. Bg11-28]|uniref:tyrosine-type recombinase/integrase n=1 Tax=Colwellia sp. Bg11-28 TaxID=2058305 RepID=UPI000C34D2CB|nr:site-specific integrase [Colwellia sp. Bg11-28]PKH88914.1 hypothetical protein CXF79_03245 [Colwellia sp. Bg11-28]
MIKRKNEIIKMIPMKLLTAENQYAINNKEVKDHGLNAKFPQLESSNSAPLCNDINSFLRFKYLKKNLQINSIRQIAGSLAKFVIFTEENSILNPIDIKQISIFKDSLIKKAEQKKLTFQSVKITLSHLQGFFHFITGDKIKHPSWNFSIRIPRISHNKIIYNRYESVQLFQCKALSNKKNQAMIELVLLSGLRASEVINLKIESLARHQDKGYLQFNSYKRGRKNTVYLSKHVMNTLDSYIAEERNKHYPNKDIDLGFVFTNMTGRRLDNSYISTILSKANLELKVLQKNITFSISNLRHTFTMNMVNEMLKRGDEIKVIEEVIGVSQLHMAQHYIKNK